MTILSLPKGIIEQWICCSKTFLSIPISVEQEILDTWGKSLPNKVEEWYQRFYRDVFNSRYGYPVYEVFQYPYTEDTILEVFDQCGFLSQCDVLDNQVQTLCLTHDVDHLAPTFKQSLKNFISTRKIKLPINKDSYLESIESLLKIDAEVAKSPEGPSTLFIASRVPTNHIYGRFIQNIIDPTYFTHDPLFEDLKQLVQKYGCKVGIHGSFLSIKDNLLKKEKSLLEQSLKLPVLYCRQHWLNLPTEDALNNIKHAGIKMDSTLGWNGSYGFRGGMARPFPILVGEKLVIWELPLVLMDGPLFHDLKLNSEQVFNKGVEILKHIAKRKGCVSINWHERAAHADYAHWFDAYKNILDFANMTGFRFLNIEQVSHEYTHD